MQIKLRTVEIADIPTLYEYQCEPDALQMAAFSSRSESDFQQHWSKIISDESIFAATILADNHVAGNVVGWSNQGRWLLGYWVGQKFWGNGIATSAVFQFLDWIPHRPLYAFVAKTNLPSQRVLEKCGFEVERGVQSQDGLDEVLYRI